MLSEREVRLLMICVEVISVKDAARKMGVTDSTAYNMLHRIRRKYKDGRKTVNTILNYKRRSPLLEKILEARKTEEEESGET